MDNFMREPFDLKRFTILVLKNIWLVALAMVVCALFFGAFYYGKEVWLGGPDEYVSKTFYCITFDLAEDEEVLSFYNDYTWDDIIDSDKIAGVAAANTGYSKEDIAKVTEVPTMADIRLFWVEVTDESPQKADKINEALQPAVLKFAEETAGFEKIEIYDVVKAQKIEKKLFVLRWFIFGALVGGVIGMLYLLYDNAIDDSMYIEKDVEKRFGILCAGVLEKNPKASGSDYLILKANLSKILEGKKKVAFAEGYENAQRELVTLEETVTQKFLQHMVDEIAEENGFDKIETVKVDYVKGKERDYFMKLREADAIIWMLPFGRNDGPRLDRAWKNLHFWNCRVDTVVLTGISKSYYKTYYAGRRRERKGPKD